MSKSSPIIVGLDIGTTKIAVIAGRKMNSESLKSWDSAEPILSACSMVWC